MEMNIAKVDSAEQLQLLISTASLYELQYLSKKVKEQKNLLSSKDYLDLLLSINRR